MTPDTYYKYRVRAKNVQGWSLTWSDEFTFITARVPDQPLAIETSLDNLKIRISWQHPADNFQPITAYKILIRNADQTDWFENTKYCDGTRFDGQSTELYCDLPVKEVLIREPYNYDFDQLVVAKVQAQNIRGWSLFSDLNTIGEKI